MRDRPVDHTRLTPKRRPAHALPSGPALVAAVAALAAPTFLAPPAHAQRFSIEDVLSPGYPMNKYNPSCRS